MVLTLESHDLAFEAVGIAVDADPVEAFEFLEVRSLQARLPWPAQLCVSRQEKGPVAAEKIHIPGDTAPELRIVPTSNAAITEVINREVGIGKSRQASPDGDLVMDRVGGEDANPYR